MIQLKVYDSPDRVDQYFVDLYETEPIKLTLSIEDITNADATSTYSKAFKVPGTRANAEFFKNAFDVNDTMFDVTIKKPAEILVDGAEFKQGHVRLERVYVNKDLDRIDYELLFLGETRDFSSSIADKTLNLLKMPDLIGGQTPGSTLTANDIVQSWEAYPQNASLTAGLHDGNILYPLIDHGNTYNDAGVAIETRISNEGPKNFTQPSHPLTIERFKPMIRAKRIWDQIFEDAGYTYTSDFIDSELFHQIYISAFGNTAMIGWDSTVSSTTSENVYHAQEADGAPGPLLLTQGINDPGENDGTAAWPFPPYYTGVQYSYYTIPVAGEYQISAQAFYNGWNLTSDYEVEYVGLELVLWNATQNLPIVASGTGSNVTLQFNVTLDTASTPNFSPGDKIALCIGNPDVGVVLDYYTITNVAFDILSAPGEFNPVGSLDNTYKQIDFIKDILTAFRLILAPDTRNPKNFIIAPWQSYINSGDLHDWSDKLVENKDVQIEPVFFTQSNQIDFSFQEDGDYVNKYHQDSYTHPYGWLEFNSGNELLKGKREIKLTGISPTELITLEGTTSTDGFYIPQIHTHSSEDTGLQHLPIKGKTRMLFYDGLISQGAHITWEFNGTRDNYPMVSPYQTWPIEPQTLNLNWSNDIQYWGTAPGVNQVGSTLYTDYWSRYISSLYGKYSRRVTAYFVLNNIDLNKFSFDDTIFVNGTYYRVEKIMDVEIGEYKEVKVQLLTANDYVPPYVIDETLFNFSVEGVNLGCSNGNGSINVTTNGTPGFAWTLSNGYSGYALGDATPGQSPYQFEIPEVSPGTYTITVIDSLGRSKAEEVVIPQAVGIPITATVNVVNQTFCGLACDGSIEVIASGGYPPLSITWSDSTATTFTRTDLCAGDYSYTITDSLDCSVLQGTVTVICEEEPVPLVYELRYVDQDCLPTENYIWIEAIQAPVNGRVFKVNEFAGCWRYEGNNIITNPNATVLEEFIDCEDCWGPAYVWSRNPEVSGDVTLNTTISGYLTINYGTHTFKTFGQVITGVNFGAGVEVENANIGGIGLVGVYTQSTSVVYGAGTGVTLGPGTYTWSFHILGSGQDGIVRGGIAEV